MMNILMTGGTGFIGSGLVEQLLDRGDQVTVLSRSKDKASAGPLSFVSRLEQIPDDAQFDAVINLAGESIAGRRWSDGRKQVLLDSRIGVTHQLLDYVERSQIMPRVVISASAIGIYGSHGDERLAESAQQLDNFSHQLCQAWEQEAQRFELLGCRLCTLRLGVVLSSQPGGAFDELSKSLKFGLASWLGSGQQWLSWVHLSDVHKAIKVMLENDSLAGTFNLTAPEPVTSRGFAEEMSRVKKPFLKAGVPGFLMRLMFGQMAQELLLEGQRVVPARLLEAGFEFDYPDLRTAMPELLS